MSLSFVCLIFECLIIRFFCKIVVIILNVKYNIWGFRHKFNESTCLRIVDLCSSFSLTFFP